MDAQVGHVGSKIASKNHTVRRTKVSAMSPTAGFVCRLVSLQAIPEKRSERLGSKCSDLTMNRT